MLTAHPQREALHNEVHARPYERLTAPLALSHIALIGSEAEGAREHIITLLRNRHLPLPAEDANHLSVDLGGVHLRWEKHTEFHTCTFWKALREPPDSFDAPALAGVPQEWLNAMPGQWLVGLHMLVRGGRGPDCGPAVQQLVRRSFQEESLVGSSAMDGDADVYTDLQLAPDGFARVLLVADGMSPRRLGRAVQRLLEVETYRMMALLGLPMAREVGAALLHAERDLAHVAGQIRSAQRHEEPELLRQLTQLAGQVESLYAHTHARFSASSAYFELVQRRIEELREQRLENLQTLGEFMDRRLAPAMQTCVWAARRQQALSERISRTSNLLRTRVEIEQQQSSQELLDAMNRRQRAQMLLQSAVEGLSVAAVTYYGAGLVGYAAKGAKAAGWPVNPDLAVAFAIPVIGLAVWWGIRRLHRQVQADVER
ncbi:DUF3422 family protein [Piscinibacter sp.]|uniref:DUF3422 family protein n=1 Tax=Piscinibacter sp. TaxID=1903157 RepID=UPI002B66F3FB|nr:DUF3422 domain-containing protein [Albitalea sp.]HUG24081.1 DUF3422 domain-containing protein [Albitalea sp.]